ncbi:MAG: YceD family protein [Candidatus Limnocylindrales bacterium]
MSDGGSPDLDAPVRRADPGGQLTFNVARLLAEGHGATRAYPVAGVMLDLGDDLRQADPLEGTVHLSRTNRGLFVSGHLTTSLDAACSRCLRPIEVPVTLDIDEEALPSVDPATGSPLDTSAEPDLLRLTDHHELELGETVREAIWLAEPIAPLCRPDCPGLCPECGLEMASGSHDHPAADIDPRLEALRGFVPERRS